MEPTDMPHPKGDEEEITEDELATASLFNSLMMNYRVDFQNVPNAADEAMRSMKLIAQALSEARSRERERCREVVRNLAMTENLKETIEAVLAALNDQTL